MMNSVAGAKNQFFWTKPLDMKDVLYTDATRDIKGMVTAVKLNLTVMADKFISLYSISFSHRFKFIVTH